MLTESELDAKLADHAAKVKALSNEAVATMLANLPRTEAKSIGTGSRYLSDDRAGEFLKAVLNAADPDSERQADGKSVLASLGVNREESWGKAALGTSDATGGWVIPNSVVDELIKPAASKNLYSQLMTVRSGVTSAAVDIPFRSAAPARAVIAPFGSTKESVDLAYNGYTATMYTLARIHDVSNQFLRQSAGAAEADALSELGAAFALGESWYIRDGSGSAMPYGFVQAAANMPAEFTSAHTAAAGTVAGSVARAIAVAGAALMGRHRVPEAAVISATGFAALLTDGADTAGFFLSGISGPQSIPGLRPGTLVSPFGVPVYVDPDLPADDLYVAEWSAFKIYHGLSYRVDTSSVSGTRWDSNVTGFRGELELGFDSRPSVFAGALQVVTDVIA